MRRLAPLLVLMAVACGSRTGLDPGVDDAGADARIDGKAPVCAGLGSTPRRLTSLAAIEDDAAVALVGDDVYFVVRPAGASTSVLQRVPLGGGAPVTVATDVACAGVASNGTYVGYSSTNGRFVALPLVGGPGLSVELADRSRCPIQAIGKTFYVYFNGNTIAGVARWPLQGDPSIVTGPVSARYAVDETYWYIPPRGTNPKRPPRITLVPWADWQSASTEGSYVPDDSTLIGQTAKELIVVTPTGQVLRTPKLGGENVGVVSSIGAPNTVAGDSVYGVAVAGAPSTALARARLVGGAVTPLATATGKSVLALGVGACGVAWIEQDPPAVWARSD